MPQIGPPPDDLGQALRDIVLRPIKTLVPPWSWKTAALTALLRGGMFFLSNIRSGEWNAVRAMIVEAVFAICAAGLIGAISQRLRRSEPVWGTVLVVCVGLPAAMVVAQLGVHRIARTPHLTAGLVASFCFAAVSSGYSWFAMRQGAMLGGTDATAVRDDIRALPRITLGFALAVPRALLQLHSKHQ